MMHGRIVKIISCSLYLDVIPYHADTIAQVEKNGIGKNIFFAGVFRENKKNSTLIDTLICAL